MTTLGYFTTSTKNEFFKLKRTFAFWLTIISALFIPIIYFLYYFFKYESLIPKDGANPWDKFVNDQVMAAGPLLIPFFIVLITSLIIQVEHNSSGIKHLFALPIPKWSVYFGKLAAVIGTILSTYILFFVFVIGIGYIVGLLRSDLQLLSFTPDYIEFIKVLFRSFVAILGIVGIQFWLSFRIKNFIIPLGIGIVLVITGLVIYRAEESQYYPYAYNMLSLFPLDKDVDSLIWFPKVSLYSLICFAAFSIAGYLNIQRMNVK